MKTINSIINDSALGTMNKAYKYAVMSLFAGITITAITLLVFMLNNMEYVSAQFNF